ncbi:hypothetical protein BDQ17DRAFT_1320892 [Cyathus striatus]|nr:hypothetical protein BDQ17DRAFT_1320892 [Cyathus striatus]
MKLTAALAFVFAAIATVGAVPAGETNAERMARGLPPMAPHRRATGVEAAKRHIPSSTPSVCASGSDLKCCFALQSPSDKEAKGLIGLLGIKNVDPNSTVGLTCGPLTSLGLNSGWCKTKAACCETDYFAGVVSTGCTRVNN